MTAEVTNNQLSAMRVTSEFCQSFFYFNLADCPSNVRIQLSDSLTDIRVTLSRARQTTIESASAFGSKTPQPFKAHHVLTDKVLKYTFFFVTGYDFVYD